MPLRCDSHKEAVSGLGIDRSTLFAHVLSNSSYGRSQLEEWILLQGFTAPCRDETRSPYVIPHQSSTTCPLMAWYQRSPLSRIALVQSGNNDSAGR